MNSYMDLDIVLVILCLVKKVHDFKVLYKILYCWWQGFFCGIYQTLSIFVFVIRFLLSPKYSKEKQPRELGYKEDWANVYKG